MKTNPLQHIHEKSPWQDMTTGGVVYGGANSPVVQTGQWRSVAPVFHPELCRQCLRRVQRAVPVDLHRPFRSRAQPRQQRVPRRERQQRALRPADKPRRRQRIGKRRSAVRAAQGRVRHEQSTALRRKAHKAPCPAGREPLAREVPHVGYIHGR